MTDWSKVSHHTINCSKMTRPVEICDVMKKLKIDTYVYEIRHNNVTIKYGMSNDNCPLHGERLYRQIGKLYSWGRHRLLGPNDITFEYVDDEYKVKYGTYMDHKSINITVWDFTNYPFETFDEDVELLRVEKELIDSYKKFHNAIPLGNNYDMDFVSRKYTIRKDLFESIFGG